MIFLQTVSLLSHNIIINQLTCSDLPSQAGQPLAGWPALERCLPFQSGGCQSYEALKKTPYKLKQTNGLFIDMFFIAP
jgi:hypothetical protein